MPNHYLKLDFLKSSQFFSSWESAEPVFLQWGTCKKCAKIQTTKFKIEKRHICLAMEILPIFFWLYRTFNIFYQSIFWEWLKNVQNNILQARITVVDLLYYKYLKKFKHCTKLFLGVTCCGRVLLAQRGSGNASKWDESPKHFQGYYKFVCPK